MRCTGTVAWNVNEKQSTINIAKHENIGNANGVTEAILFQKRNDYSPIL